MVKKQDLKKTGLSIPAFLLLLMLLPAMGNAAACFIDSDYDGYGGPYATISESCNDPGYSDVSTDCDDTDPNIHPDAAETPGDGIDSDCDGIEICYRDNDFDGYAGGSDTVTDDGDLICNSPGEASFPGQDCDDSNPLVYPGASDIPDNGIDEDCNGVDTVTCFTDGDMDGFGTADGSFVVAADGSCDTAQQESPTSDDCDDSDAGIHPSASEIPDNGIDEDCSGMDTVTCYPDNDMDGFGDAAGSFLTAADGSCDTAQQESANNHDCDDTDADIHPAAAEIPGDGKDSDCDGYELCYADRDYDGYAGNADTVVDDGDLSCSGPGEASSPGQDCDDTDAAVYPGALEIPDNGIDDDCNGIIDDNALDSDSDTVSDAMDNCPCVSNPDQEDSDQDGIGDACNAKYYPGDLDRDCDVDGDDLNTFSTDYGAVGSP